MRTILLISLLMLAPISGQGAASIDLYSGEVAVADQGIGERERALPLALAQVLQKISGLRNFDDKPLVFPALDRAQDILLTYYYRKAERALADGSVVEELLLVARFSEESVNEMARALQLPLWRPERQPLVAWLILDDGAGRRVMPIEFGYVRQSMEEVAGRRGLPLEWPVPDADGVYEVDEQILWGGYTEDLATADGDGVMIAAARREGPVWGVRINLGYQGQDWTWRLEDVDLQTALDEGLQQGIDEIAALNSIAATDLGSWQQDLTVRGLGGAADYRRCLNYLEGISVVNGVNVVATQPGAVTFRLALNALPRYLEQTIMSGEVLRPADADGGWLLVGAEPGDG